MPYGTGTGTPNAFASRSTRVTAPQLGEQSTYESRFSNMRFPSAIRPSRSFRASVFVTKTRLPETATPFRIVPTPVTTWSGAARLLRSKTKRSRSGMLVSRMTSPPMFGLVANWSSVPWFIGKRQPSSTGLPREKLTGWLAPHDGNSVWLPDSATAT